MKHFRIDKRPYCNHENNLILSNFNYLEVVERRVVVEMVVCFGVEGFHEGQVVGLVVVLELIGLVGCGLPSSASE